MKNHDMMIQIDNIIIAIDASKEPIIIKWLLREFSSFAIETEKQPAIHLRFTFSQFAKPSTYTCFGDSIIAWDNYIALKIEAHLRRTWLQFSTVPHLGSTVVVFLTDEATSQFGRLKCEIFRMLSLNFLYPWQNAIIDFVHGSLLGILQLRLSENGATFLHASAASNKNRGLLLPGWAQSGKSTFMTMLVNKYKWQALSEDYCIISQNRSIIAYPKQLRVYPYQVGRDAKTRSRDGLITRFLNCFNICLMSLLKTKGVFPIRVVSHQQVFTSTQSKKHADLSAIVFIQKGCFEDIVLSKTKPNLVVDACVDMMLAEMKNLNGFYCLLSCYGTVKQSPNQLSQMAEGIRKTLTAAFQHKPAYFLYVPFINCSNTFEQTVEALLRGVLEITMPEIED